VPEAIVIGAGPNGLVCANMLADRGWDVVVFEAEPTPGGAVRTAALIEPGYRNDLFSAFYPLAVASPAISDLHLEDHGLEWCRAPLVLAHPARDGTCPALSMDLDETADLLGGGADADAWRRLAELWNRVGDGLLGAMLGPMPPVRATARLATSLPRRDWVRFARFVLLPVRRIGEEDFTTDATRRLLAGNALHADLAPEQTLSGFFGWLLASLAQTCGWPVPKGGAGELSGAMVRRLESRGGRVVCNAPVDKIIVRNGRAVGVRLADGTEVDATRAVIADVDAPRLFLDLVGAEHLPPRVAADITRFQWDPSTVKVDWNLDGAIPWDAEPARRAGTVHVAESIDSLTMGFARLATGALPDPPFLVLGQQSMTDPSRQPAGKETAWAYTHIPRSARPDPERLADRMQAEIEALAPGFESRIRGRHIFHPGAMQHRDGNLAAGAINGGTAQLHQQLVFRPVPGLGRPETPVTALYLGSSSAHPGGGVHGVCGSNAARAALAGDRVRRLRGLTSRST
jgi:phytoene dehydrogenase-like protein